MTKRVLIIGAKGMLGQALVRVFSSPSSPPLNPHLLPLRIRGSERGLQGKLLAWDREDCDITDRTAVLQKITDTLFSRSGQKCITPPVIVNAAAYNYVDGAEKDATLANKINGEAVGYLAEAAARIGATFVHYSTDYVFDGTKKEGYREDDTPNPISAYGRSKLLGEEAVLSLRAETFPLLAGEGRVRSEQRVYLIRTSRLFGKPGSGKQSFVDLMLERAKTTEDGPLESRGPSSVIEAVDEELASPTYVEDLAQRTREIIEQKKPSGIYHVTNSGACTWYGFTQEIFRQNFEVGPPFGGPTSEHARAPLVTPVPASRFPRPAKRPAYSILLNTKLPPLRSWQEAFHDYLLSCKK